MASEYITAFLTESIALLKCNMSCHLWRDKSQLCKNTIIPSNSHLDTMNCDHIICGLGKAKYKVKGSAYAAEFLGMQKYIDFWIKTVFKTLDKLFVWCTLQDPFLKDVMFLTDCWAMSLLKTSWWLEMFNCSLMSWQELG